MHLAHYLALRSKAQQALQLDSQRDIPQYKSDIRIH
jgi:hypothetical protein